MQATLADTWIVGSQIHSKVSELKMKLLEIEGGGLVSQCHIASDATVLAALLNLHTTTAEISRSSKRKRHVWISMAVWRIQQHRV